MSNSTRDLKFFMARVADQAERSEDVVKIFKEIIEIDPVLSAEERNLLSVAYKALTGSKRTNIRTVNQFIQDPSKQSSQEQIASLTKLRAVIIGELSMYCEDFINLVDGKLLPVSKDPATQVFYEKLKADYYRYSVEFKEGEERDAGSKKAKESYEKAMVIAADKLIKANPQYLGLALNYSVFLYEIAGMKNEAIELADKTFKSAVDLLDKLVDDEYSESTLILQLLKDNVQLWSDEQASQAH